LPTAIAEAEPNDVPAAAQALELAPGGISVNGRIHASDGTPDSDVFRFHATAGQTLILETAAAREKSPCDTKLEVLHTDGKPVLRALLQATRDSSVTFRPADANQTGFRLTNWEEMELNEYLYVGGEVCRLFRFPQGPDSDFVFYESAGRRRAYFDTTATAHYLDEPCYIVRPLPPDAQPIPTGLPIFPLPYVNDDDGERRLGTDSRLTFTAHAEGNYLVRVTDTRGFSGEKYSYRLTIRPPRPGFTLSLSDRNPTVNAGSAKRFTVRAERIDGFDGEIAVRMEGALPGFTITSPLIIPAGHATATGVVHALPDAKQPSKESLAAMKVHAAAMINGRTVTQTIDGLGEIKLAAKPKLLVRLELDVPQPNVSAVSAEAVPAATEPPVDSPADPHQPARLELAPGTTVTARLVIERNGFAGEVKFDVDNLPHGVIVDNIGLSGILITADRSERQLFLTARDWVGEQERLFHAIAQAEGNQASLPMLLVIKRPKKSP
jgi:hypothetical protein